MSKQQQSETDRALVTRKVNGNPEGKGLSGLLVDWQRSEPGTIVAKPRHQVLAELFTSMLVLSATFRFRPAVGTPNFLYWTDGEWSLSLVSPDEWSAERRDGFVGTCLLQPDMTWTIAPSDRLADDTPVDKAVGRFYEAFAGSLDTDLTLEEILPFHAARLRYYPRLYASALSRSVRASITKAGETAVSSREWFRQLPHQQVLLADSPSRAK